MQSPSGKPILAAEPPEAPAPSSRASGKPGTIRLRRPEKTASLPSHSEGDRGEEQALLRELLKDVEPVLAKAPVDELTTSRPAVKPGARVAYEHASETPAVKREVRVAEEPATRNPTAPVAGMTASEKPAVKHTVQVADEPASKTQRDVGAVRVAGEPAVKRDIPVADEPASKNSAAKREFRVADEPASKTPAVKREVPVADEPKPQNPAVKRDISVADEPASKEVKGEVPVDDESASNTPAVKREVRIADEPDPQHPAVKWDIPGADEPASKNPAVKLGVASENHMSPDTGKVIAEEAVVSPQSRTSGSSRTSRTSSSDSSTSSRTGEADGTATSSKSSQSSNLQAKAAEMQVMQPPVAQSPVATGSSSRNPRPDSVDQEGAAESNGGYDNEVRIQSSDLPASKVAGPTLVADETEPQKSEESGLRGAAEHKVETTSMASSPKTMAKETSLHAAHPDVLEPSVPCFGEQLSPDLQPASVVISSEPPRTKDTDEQASPASPESAGIQPQPSALSAEGLSETTSPPIRPVVADGMDTLIAPPRKIGMLDWAAAEPLHPHYETAQAIKLPPRSEWWVHEKLGSC